jgi:CRP-like cAMP-binding protein
LPFKCNLQRYTAESKLGADLNLRILSAGDLLIRKGERAKEVFLIKEGRCVVVVDVVGRCTLKSS